MSAHDCHREDDDGRPLSPDVKGCNRCRRAWCERCDPSPSAMCHFCNGTGTDDEIVPVPDGLLDPPEPEPVTLWSADEGWHVGPPMRLVLTVDGIEWVER